MELEIDGMTCGACVESVRTALERLPGVLSAVVRLGGASLVHSADSPVDAAAAVAALDSAGFDARVVAPPATHASFPKPLASRVLSFKVTGMVCGACVDWVRSALREFDAEGGKGVHVSLASGRVTLSTWAPMRRLLRAVAAAGFVATKTDGFEVDVVVGADDEPLVPTQHTTAQRLHSVAASSDGARLRVTGLSCAACTNSVEALAKGVEGVASASCSLLSSSLTLKWHPGAAPAPEEVAAAVRRGGYGCDVVDPTAARCVSLRVGGFVCDGCPSRVSRVLRGVPGVSTVAPACAALKPHTSKSSAPLAAEPAPGGEMAQPRRTWSGATTATFAVSYDAERVDPRALFDALSCLGYEVALDSTADDISGADAAAAAEVASLRRAFLGSLAFTLPLVLLAMAFPLNAAVKTALDTNLLAAPRMLPASSLVAFALATPVQFVYGARFFTGAFHALKRRSANMDVLIALGTGSAYAASIFAVLLSSISPSLAGGFAPLFDTSSMLVCFVVLGKWLEARARGRTADALRSLARLQPPTAALRTPSGALVPIPASLLRVGDIVDISSSDRVPADCVLIAGALDVDEALLTGEAAPVCRRPGDRLAAGSTAVAGRCSARCAAVGEATGLARIVALVRDAQADKAPVQALADAASSVFVPIIVAASVITFVSWVAAGQTGSIPPEWYSSSGDGPAGLFLFAFLFALTVLVVACPCALGLAVPCAVMVATGLGARFGLLFKGGAPLQAAAGATDVCLDKTGTLTAGRPAVAAVEILSPQPPGAALLASSRASVLALCAAVQVEGEAAKHPLARALLTAAAAEGAALPAGVTVASRQPVIGRGVAAWLSTTATGGEGCGGDSSSLLTPVSLGSPAWATAAGARLSPSTAARVDALEARGCTVVVLCVGPPRAAARVPPDQLHCGGDDDGSGGVPPAAAAAAAVSSSSSSSSSCAVALVALSDALKPDATAGVAALHALGLRVHLLTGDNPRAAAAAASAAGIPPSNVRASCLPGNKLAAIRALQRAGSKVLFVGDGANDGPALAAADCGAAVGGGAELAVDAGGVVLVHARVRDVAAAIELARAAMRRIRINLACSLVFNALGVPIAAGVLFPSFRARLPPEAASAAMAASSVAVVLSSLGLATFRGANFGADAAAAPRADAARAAPRAGGEP